MARIVLALIAAALLAACGSPVPPGVVAVPPTATPPPLATTPAPGFDVLITDRDRDVTVHAGQRIELYLRQNSGMTKWANVSSDNTAVLAPVPTGITAVRGVTIAGFRAVEPGTAMITAVAGADCSPGQACPMYAVLFSVRVTVT